MGVVNYLSTHLTLGGGLLASIFHAPLYLWIAANLFVFRSVEAWHWIMFGMGYGSAVAAALVSGSKHAKPWVLLTMQAYWPLQSWTMLRALVELQFQPHFWAKTQHGVSFASDRPAPTPPTAADNVIQLEFPFSPPADAATHQLAGRW